MTHEGLVQRAAKWLRRKHAVVVTEVACAAEEPDALGFQAGFKPVVTTLVEAKVSKSDFYADKKKGELRMGDFRYYLVPEGLIEAESCPAGWGLLYASVSGDRISVVREAEQAQEKNWRDEQAVLVSCLRRVFNTAPSGISVKCYKWQSNGTATIGVAD